MVGLQTLDLAIGVRVPASQPIRFKQLQRPEFRVERGVAVYPKSLSLSRNNNMLADRQTTVFSGEPGCRYFGTFSDCSDSQEREFHIRAVL